MKNKTELDSTEFMNVGCFDFHPMLSEWALGQICQTIWPSIGEKKHKKSWFSTDLARFWCALSCLRYVYIWAMFTCALVTLFHTISVYIALLRSHYLTVQNRTRSVPNHNFSCCFIHNNTLNTTGLDIRMLSVIRRY